MEIQIENRLDLELSSKNYGKLELERAYVAIVKGGTATDVFSTYANSIAALSSTTKALLTADEITQITAKGNTLS